MIVLLGNRAPAETYREEVSAEGNSAEDLRTLAVDAGVPTEGTKAELAERLSAVHRFRALEIPSGAKGAVTTVNVPDGTPLLEAVITITAPKGVWSYHSRARQGEAWPAVEPPAWVSCSNKALEVLLAQHFGCPAGVRGGYALSADTRTDEGDDVPDVEGAEGAE